MRADEPGGSKAHRIVLWSLIVALALVSSTTYHLGSEQGGRALAIELAALLDASVAGTVTVGRIEALGLDEVIVHDIRVASAAGENLASIERLRLRADASTLGSDAVQVHDLEVTAASISFRPEGDGLALAAALRPTGPPRREAAASLTIERVRLAEVELRDLPEGISVRDLALEGRVTTEAAPELEIASLEGEVRREGELVAHLTEARGHLVAEGASEVEARLESDDSFVRMEGSLTRTAGQIASFRAAAELDLSEERLERLWTSDAALVLGSKLAGNIEVEGGDGTLHGSASLVTDGGALTLRVDEDTEGIEARVYSESLVLSEIIDGADLDPVGGEVVAHVGNPSPDDGTRSVEIEARDVHYGEHVIPEAVVGARLGDEHIDIERVSIPAWTGDEGELSLFGRIGFDRSADLTLRADLPGLAADDNVQRQAPGLRGAVEADLTLRLTADEEPTIDVDGRLAVRDAGFGKARVAALEVRGTARGEAKRPEVDLAIRGRRIVSDLVTLRSIRGSLEGGPESYVLRGRAALGERRSLDVALDGARSGDGLDVHGDVTLTGALAAPVTFAISALRLADDHTISLGEVQARGAGIDASASGTYRPEGASELEVALESLDLGAATGSELTRGTGRATLRASGTLAHPEVELDATLTDAAAGPLHAPEVRLSAGISAADRSVRVALGGDFEGYGRLALDANGRLGAGPTLQRRVERTDWDAELELDDVPLTLAMFLSPDLPPWDGVVDATLGLDGVLESPDAHLVADVRGFAASGSDPVDADVRLDFVAPHADVVVSLSDRHGPLGTLSGRARVEPAALRASLDRHRIAESASWSLSLNMPRRRLDRLPRPLRRELPLAATVEGQLSHDPGSGPSGEASIVLTRLDESDDAGCRRGGVERISVDVDLGATSTLRFDANGASLHGELSATTPLARWLADGLPSSPPPMTLEAHASHLDLATIPGLCERASGTVDVEAHATRLLTNRPRGRLSVRSSNLRLGDGDAFAASLSASARDERVHAQVGVTSGPHRGRLRLATALRFDGLVPRRPRVFDVEQLVYRNAGGSAELSGTGHLGESLSGGVVLDGAIRRLPIVRDGERAGRLNARAHVEASYGSESRELLARFTETSFTLAAAPRLSRRERQEQREARRAARLARQQRQRTERRISRWGANAHRPRRHRAVLGAKRRSAARAQHPSAGRPRRGRAAPSRPGERTWRPHGRGGRSLRHPRWIHRVLGWRARTGDGAPRDLRRSARSPAARHPLRASGGDRSALRVRPSALTHSAGDRRWGNAACLRTPRSSKGRCVWG